MTLVPAYGRDYKSKGDALRDFAAGKDFRAISHDGEGYTTREELKAKGIRTVQIRYDSLRKVCIATIE